MICWAAVTGYTVVIKHRIIFQYYISHKNKVIIKTSSILLHFICFCRYKCSACDKSYAQKVGLKIHLEQCQLYLNNQNSEEKGSNSLESLLPNMFSKYKCYIFIFLSGKLTFRHLILFLIYFQDSLI